MVLFLGGSASGKSELAEDCAVALSAPSAFGSRRLYIATMQPFGEEARQRIERHRSLRAGKGFDSRDCYVDLSGTDTSGYDTVLLECMSNLTANEMYREGVGRPDWDGLADKICGDVSALREKVQNLVIVTNDVHSDGGGYDSETARYIGILGEINTRLAQQADAVVEAVCGIPVTHKGALPEGIGEGERKC